MRKLAVLIALLITVMACKEKSNYSKVTSEPTTEKKATTNVHEIVVKEFLEAGGYTYLNVDEGTENYWLAIPPTTVKVGETYFYNGGMTMKGFESKALNKTFDEIKFVDAIRTTKEEIVKKKVENPHKENKKEALSVLAYKIEKQDNEIKLESIFSEKETYANKEIEVKGIVVKVNKNIMDRNWIHIVDGTKTAEKSSLAITSQDLVKVGDTVTFKGKLILDKDFGYNYVYDIILEDAKHIK
jgi:hypothetical protein